MKYCIKIEERLIGWTAFEKADPPMGVVTGKIIYSDSDINYREWLALATKHDLDIFTNYPDDNVIGLSVSGVVSVFNGDGVELCGVGTIVEGFDDEGYEITILGIAYPFFQEEFPEHVERYKNYFE